MSVVAHLSVRSQGEGAEGAEDQTVHRKHWKRVAIASDSNVVLAIGRACQMTQLRSQGPDRQTQVLKTIHEGDDH